MGPRRANAGRRRCGFADVSFDWALDLGIYLGTFLVCILSGLVPLNCPA